MTDAVLVLFVSAAGVYVRVHFLTGVIICHGTSMVMSLRWPLDTPPKVIGTYWLFDLALGYIFCKYF